MQSIRYIHTAAVLAAIIFLPQASHAEAPVTKQAAYADLEYDVVYVRCPRTEETITVPDGKGTTLANWNGVNDLWLSVTNNLIQRPGCDLVLHKGTQSVPVSTLPLGHRDRELVLVDCDETDTSQPVCSIADPFVSLDGRSIYYTRFEDTRTHITDYGIPGGAGFLNTNHFQSLMELYPDKSANNGKYASRMGVQLKPYTAPACIYRYDLDNPGVSTKISPNCDLADPTRGMAGGRAHAHPDAGGNPDWRSKVPVMDTAPIVLPDGKIAFTSNRDNGFGRFQLFTMTADGKNLQLIGHRAMGNQLHPYPLMDGRIVYTSTDRMLQKTQNNNFSLFSINQDGGDPFVFAGENDPTLISYHYVTQLSGGDIVVNIYYNKNNMAMGSLLRFPVDPPNADFVHISGSLDADATNLYTPSPDQWVPGNLLLPFARKHQYKLTPQAGNGDNQAGAYADSTDYWIHPSRVPGGRTITIDGANYVVDRAEIRMTGRYLMPAAAPGNDLITTYTIGGSSSMPPPSEWNASLQTMLDHLGKDAGIWLIPLSDSGRETVGHIADDGRIIVDFPEYHEIMARAVVSYEAIYGKPLSVRKTPRHDGQDARLPEGAPFALSGASSLIDRETMGLNGTPWNMSDGGGTMSGRTYLNLGAQGGDLAIYDSSEIAGIRVTMPVPTYPLGSFGGEDWAGEQAHHLRILGEFPVHKPSVPVDGNGNPDTSFIVRLPADTPFLFQAIDKRGMALNLETTSRSAVRGEKQLCEGCHVHTDGIPNPLDPLDSYAHKTAGYFGDFTQDSAPLFDGGMTNGVPTTAPAKEIYSENEAPGVSSRKSFAADWVNGISQTIEQYCASCHAEGKPAQVKTGLLLDGSDATYDLITKNAYRDSSNNRIDWRTKPDVGLDPADFDDPNLDRITLVNSCCLASRWLSVNSARSSMLIWALYGERLDGRDNTTGLPPQGSGVPVDTNGRENPAIWPAVAAHAAYLDGSSAQPGTTTMPEHAKRLLARWIDIGAPKQNVHSDMMRPVMTFTPINDGTDAAPAISTVKVGLWDDSALDLGRFRVTRNGVDITPTVNPGSPLVIDVPLGDPITAANQDSETFTFEIWDKPDRRYDLISPNVTAANRNRQVLTGRALMQLLTASSPNSPPTSTSARCETIQDTPCVIVPTVIDTDAGDSFTFQVASSPQNGRANIVLGQIVYTPNSGFIGDDTFSYDAIDTAGSRVTGTATVVVARAVDTGGTGDTGNTGDTGDTGSNNENVSAAKSNINGGGSTAPLILLALLMLLAFRSLRSAPRKNTVMAHVQHTQNRGA